MWFVIVFGLLYATFVFHEVAHFVAMRHKGVGVREVSAGFPVGLRWGFTPHTGIFSGVRVSFSPFTFWLGASVKETPAGAQTLFDLSYSEQAFVYGSGPLANFIAGCVLFSLSSFLYAMVGGVENWEVATWCSYIVHLLQDPNGWRLYVPLLAIPPLWFGRRFFCAYIAPAVSVAIVAWIAHYLMKSGVQGVMSNVVGPVGFYYAVEASVHNIAQAVETTAILSVLMGAMNFLPFFPLDGGQLYMTILQKIKAPRIVRETFQYAGAAIVLSFLVMVLSGDLIHYVL